MKPRPQILWEEGLLLRPQHLQMQDLVHHSLLAPLYRLALPYFWGVAELDLDEGALAEGAVALRQGSFLFQDGSYAVLGSNAVLEGRLLKDGWREGKQLTVYLGVRRWDEGGPNVSLRPEGDCACVATRSVAGGDPEEVCDLHLGGSVAGVRRQRLLLRLFWEAEVERLGDYHLIPLLRVERRGEGACLDPAFVPPLVSLAASPWLCQTLATVKTLLASSVRELERRQRMGVAELSRADLALVLTQLSLNRCLPLLTHRLECGASHPWHLYGILCQLIGELSTFSAAGDEAAVLPYDHGAPAPCFSSVRERIEVLLKGILAAPESVVPLARQGDLFSAQLTESIFNKGNRYFLSLRSEKDPAELLRALQSSVKASTREHLRVLSARALPGIGLTHTPVTPPGVPPLPHTLYVELDQHNEQWRLVSSQQNLALYWDDSPGDLEMELLVLGNCSAS